MLSCSKSKQNTVLIQLSMKLLRFVKITHKNPKKSKRKMYNMIKHPPYYACETVIVKIALML